MWPGRSRTARRRRQSLAAPPQPHRAGVARAGPRRRARSRAAACRRRARPRRPWLRAGRNRRRRSAGGKIELAQHDGVAAAARQAQDGAAHGSSGSVSAPLPDPVLALGRGQRVEVEQDFPLRRRAAELVERRAPPKAARLRGVVPEVVHQAAAPAGIGRLSGRSKIAAACRVRLDRASAERRQGARVLRVDPCRRAPALALPPARDRDRRPARRAWVSGRSWRRIFGRRCPRSRLASRPTPDCY